MAARSPGSRGVSAGDRNLVDPCRLGDETSRPALLCLAFPAPAQQHAELHNKRRWPIHRFRHPASNAREDAESVARRRRARMRRLCPTLGAVLTGARTLVDENRRREWRRVDRVVSGYLC